MSYVLKEHWYRVGAGIKVTCDAHPDRVEHYVVIKDYDLVAVAAGLGIDITQPLENPQAAMDRVYYYLLTEGYVEPYVKH